MTTTTTHRPDHYRPRHRRRSGITATLAGLTLALLRAVSR